MRAHLLFPALLLLAAGPVRAADFPQATFASTTVQAVLDKIAISCMDHGYAIDERSDYRIICSEADGGESGRYVQRTRVNYNAVPADADVRVQVVPIEWTQTENGATAVQIDTRPSSTSDIKENLKAIGGHLSG